MANPLLNGLQSNFGVQNPIINRIKQMMHTMSIAKNPMQIINSNPQLASVINMCKGQNPKDVFYSMCKEKNANPEDVLNSLR